MGKYIIDVPDEGKYRLGQEYIFANNGERIAVSCNLADLTPYTEPDQEAIEDEVWEFVRRIIGMTEDKYCECFDIDDIADDDFASKYSYQEAKKVYEEWEKEKKEIRVGDEVIPLDTQYNTMVVTKLWVSEYDDEWVDTIGGDGKTYNFLKISVKKTGRHFDSVEKLLEEMREETE